MEDWKTLDDVDCKRELRDLCSLPNNAHLIRGNSLDSRKYKNKFEEFVKIFGEYYTTLLGEHLRTKPIILVMDKTKKGGSLFKNNLNFYINPKCQRK